MGVWDFVIGILVGVLLACVSYVLQTSQISAIRGQLYGGVANSTVRRHPIQHRFLQDAGCQIHIMKLAGYLFFGTIVGVEKQIRHLLDETFYQQPIRFLVLDMYNADGVDFSAAEAFTRINRILKAKNIRLIICGMSLEGEVGRSLRNVGLFDEEDGVQYFLSLNSALEYCENELLKTFYHQNDAEREVKSRDSFLGKSFSSTDRATAECVIRGAEAAAEEILPAREHNVQFSSTESPSSGCNNDPERARSSSPKQMGELRTTSTAFAADLLHRVR